MPKLNALVSSGPNLYEALASPVTANRNMMAQASRSRNKPAFQMKEPTPQGLLDAAALATSPFPVVGDVVGLGADANRFINEPESRTPLNFGLAALGLIPFLPPLMSAGLGKLSKTGSIPKPQGVPSSQMGAIVYHGSPHKFDQFDSSKIGTGEGAQAYGHGLYFAENPKVAKEYSKMSPVGPQPAPRRYLNGVELETGTPEYKAASLLESMTLPQARKLAKEWVTNPSPHDDVAYYQKVYETLNQIPAKSAVKQKMGGNLYKVDLPDEAIAKMLDWDKPLSQQAPEVQRALQNTKNKQLRAVVDYASSPYSTPGLEGEVKTMGEAIKLLGMNASPAKGSAMLAKQGIPGIRYLDGGSRGAGQGTSNYVVFPGNESLLKILSRE